MRAYKVPEFLPLENGQKVSKHWLYLQTRPANNTGKGQVGRHSGELSMTEEQDSPLASQLVSSVWTPVLWLNPGNVGLVTGQTKGFFPLTKIRDSQKKMREVNIKLF